MEKTALILPDKVKDILKTLKTGGFEAYVVGGAVRDLVMGQATSDWDFATDARPEEITTLFPDSFYDNAFGTVGVKIKNSAGETVDVFEITTFRNESGYSDSRHPDQIAWGKSLEKDLSRRDFTVNAMAFDGENLIDPFGGKNDLDAKIIRTVGSPDERFTEDSLRMMRAVRLAAQLGFTIETGTLEAIRKLSQNISNISRERIRDEFIKLLASAYPADGILILKNSGLLDFILPEFGRTFGVGQKSEKRHHIYDVGTHSVQALKYCPSPDPITRLATLIHDSGKTDTRRVDDQGIVTFHNHELVSARHAKAVATRLRLSREDSKKLYILVRWHQFSVDERQTDSAIRRIIKRVGKEYLEEMLALRTADRLGGGAQETSWRLELFKKRLEEVQKQPFSVTDLKINGYDVMSEFGCKPGPVIGSTLAEIFRLVENNEIENERETLLEHLKKMAPN